MKPTTFLLLFFLCTKTLQAREGMWLPFLLEHWQETEMKNMGMKMSLHDVYDINHSSLKDAVVLFGSGCTGELISDQGLVLTNHHCGYGTVQGLSSVTHDYLTNGYWAMKREEEIPCPGLTVTFIVKMEEVTRQVNQGLRENMSDSLRAAIRNRHIDSLQQAYANASGYDAQIKSFYAENVYYVILSEKFRDVRLVAFPPNGIGKFGGDTDNWAWPRHTGDFSVFRIYADAHNKPAPYSTHNQPYHPKKSFTISLKGIKEKDFTCVYGFPGRTNEYLCSDGIQEVINILDPIRISMRSIRLGIMEQAMKQSHENFIRYASKQSGLANAYKKWQGELLGLQTHQVVVQKEKEEQAFMHWVQRDGERTKKYGELLSDLHLLYQAQAHLSKQNEYLNEALSACELIKSTAAYTKLLTVMDTLQQLDSLAHYTAFFKDYLRLNDAAVDQQITLTLFNKYAEALGPQWFTGSAFLENLFAVSLPAHPERYKALFEEHPKADIRAVLLQDPAYRAYLYIDSLQNQTSKALRSNQQKILSRYALYMEALLAYRSGHPVYPDANATLRITYGRVEGMYPRDGMQYTWYSTLDGVMEKANDSIDEFRVPAKLKTLYQQKDFGSYAIPHHGHLTVPLAFLASNHTTGGNSGSPVLNASGELIGTNFDRIWEGTMSDLHFEPDLCRNITLDIRYTLFILDKFGGASWLLNEMKFAR